MLRLIDAGYHATSVICSCTHVARCMSTKQRVCASGRRTTIPRQLCFTASPYRAAYLARDMQQQPAQEIKQGQLLQPQVEEQDTPAKPEDYVHVDHLQLVQPYYFDFKCYVKQRWEGKNIIDIFAEEFPMLTREYYTCAHQAGRLRVEGHNLALDAPLKTGMCIRHFIHRHEPPVLAGTIQVIGETPEFVAVNKPGGMPVHTVGQYRKNTVIGIMQAQHPELGLLYPTYRLDKPVSGVLLLARSSKAAANVRVHLEERTCSKVYVARVMGRFPETGPAGLQVDVPLTWDCKSNLATAIGPGCIDENLVASAKPALTVFSLLLVAPDGLTSVVECRPKTGRTHQIRVHFQYLGHPIANDTQYGGTYGLPLAFRRLAKRNPVISNANVLHTQTVQQTTSDAGPAAATTAGTAAAKGSTVVYNAGNVDGTATEGHIAKKQKCEPAAGSNGGPEAETTSIATTTDSSPRTLAHDTDLAAAPAALAALESSIALSIAPSIAAPPAAPAAPAAAPAMPAAAAVAAAAAETPAAAATAAAVADRASEAAAAETRVQQSTALAGDMFITALCHDDSGSSERAEMPEAISMLYNQERFRVSPDCVESVCPHCPCLVPRGYPIELEPLWLHAKQYSSADWCFEAPLPEWAAADFLPAPRSNKA